MLSLIAGKPPPIPMRSGATPALSTASMVATRSATLNEVPSPVVPNSTTPLTPLSKSCLAWAASFAESTLPSIASGVADATQNPRIASVITPALFLLYFPPCTLHTRKAQTLSAVIADITRSQIQRRSRMNMVTPIERPDQLLGALRDRLGAAAVLVGTDVPARNCNDWGASLPQTPLAVIRPVDAQGVADAVLTCPPAQPPVVPPGGVAR